MEYTNSEQEDLVSYENPESSRYQFESFHFVVRYVMERYLNASYLEILSPVVEAFKSISDDAQALYIRLFLRRMEWFRECNISYIFKNKLYKDCVEELVNAGFCLGNESISVDIAKGLLTYDERVSLSRSFPYIKDRLMKSSKKVETSKKMQQTKIHGYFKESLLTIQDVRERKFIEGALKCLGNCVAISGKNKKIFEYIFLIFIRVSQLHQAQYRTHREMTLPSLMQEVFFCLLQLSSNKLKLPLYEWKESMVTLPQNFDSFVEFYDCYNLYLKYNSYFGMNKKAECLLMCDEVIARMMIVSTHMQAFLEEDMEKYLNRLKNEVFPMFDRKNRNESGRIEFLFNSSEIICKIASSCIELLESAKFLDKAVDLTKLLLSQSKFYTRKRGYWWTRLAIMFNNKHSQPITALRILLTAIEDPNLADHELYSLSSRIKRMEPKLNNGKSKKKQPLPDWSLDGMLRAKKNIESVKECRITHLTGIQYSKSHSKKTFFVRKSQGLSRDSVIARNESKTSKDDDLYDSQYLAKVSSVEEYVMDHYISCGQYTHGIFGEGTPMCAIFGLIFWDIIYQSTSSTTTSFISQFQYFPLDFFSSRFYDRRKDTIDQFIAQLKTEPLEAVLQRMQTIWNDNVEVLNPCLDWRQIDEIDQLKQIVESIGLDVIIKFCEILIKNFKSKRSGLPDLLLWNHRNKTHLFCEVKGPGDHLSDKQKVWLTQLSDIGANVEVCHVSNIASKREFHTVDSN